MAKKLFIGYDLGDGETITDMAILDDSQIKSGNRVSFAGMTMPDNNTPGQAIPTVFGLDRETGSVVFSSSIVSDPEAVEQIRSNFKRRPSDLVAPVDETRRAALIRTLQEGFPDRDTAPELYTEPLLTFADAVKQFTDALFTDGNYNQVIASAAVGCQEIVFSVGHPTRWDELDAAIYRAILMNTVIGEDTFASVPASLVMAAESRAAFLYIKNNTGMADILPKGKCALLIDMGSSTIDLTVMAADSHNHVYNSGSNYLGARGIDYLIMDWYLDHLRQDPDDWAEYERLVEKNPTMRQAAVLCCRRAKEDVYSQGSGKSHILFADFAPVRVRRDEVTRLATEQPLAPILLRYFNVPQQELFEMGSSSWTELFRRFLTDQKYAMAQQELDIARIILTGSASKMPFAREIVADVFEDAEVLNDGNPSRSISMGLSLVGPSNDTSLGFQQELISLVDNDLPDIIQNDLPSLAGRLATVIDGVVMDIVQTSIAQWRSGAIRTLNDMTASIEKACRDDQLEKLLNKSPEYKEVIHDWLIRDVGQDIALKLKKVCDRYGLQELDLDQLNLMQVSGITIGGKLVVAPGEEIVKTMSTVLSLVAGIISAAIMPTVLGIVLGVIMVISADIGITLFMLLMAIPGEGWALLIALGGYLAFKAVKNGMSNARDQLTAKLQAANLPLWARKLIKDEKIRQKIAETDMKSKIRNSIMEPENVREIVRSVSDRLSVIIMKRAEDIKYVIESK